MTQTDDLYAVGGLIVAIAAGAVVFRFKPKKVNTVKYSQQWHDLQKQCASRKTWHRAIVEADKLLDDVLKRQRYKGKTTGERLVAAQHKLTNNEGVWFGHKLCNRIVLEGLVKPSKRETLEALNGFRQALKDLGALKPNPLEAEDE